MTWDKVKLGEIVQFNYGKALTSSERVEDGEHLVFGSSGVVGRHDAALTRERTIIVGRKGSAGSITDAPLGGWPIDTAYYLSSTGKHNFDWRYLYYALSHLNLSRLATATAMPGLNREDAYREVMPLPPLASQQRIAAVLDQANEICQGRAAMIDKISALRRQIFLEMFGDPATNPKGYPTGTVRDLVISASYGTSAKAGAEGNHPILRMGNIDYSGGWNFRDLKYIDLTPADVERYTVRQGDILFNRTNSRELVGKMAVYREERPMAFAGYLVRVRLNDKANPEFLSAYFNTDFMKQRLQDSCKAIVGMANINAQEMQNYPIYIPPIETQVEFARRIGELLSFETKLSKAAEAMAHFAASLQARAFSGELALRELEAAL